MQNGLDSNVTWITPAHNHHPHYHQPIPVRHQHSYVRHHHEHHWGPFFEEEGHNSSEGGQLAIAVPLGSSMHLNCRVGMLHDKTVMWLRKNGERVNLLTVGLSPYTSDPRLQVKFQYPNNWRLYINPVQREDDGLYLCQVSTHPPRVLITNVTVLADDNALCRVGLSFGFCLISVGVTIAIVNTMDMISSSSRKAGIFLSFFATCLAPELKVVDEHGHSVHDRYYKTGSTIELTCRVLTPAQTASSQVTWRKDGSKLPDKITISPISKDTSPGEALVSRLVIPKAVKADSGTYSCALSKYSSVLVHVHVLNGEKQAAVQHDTWGSDGSSAKKPCSYVLLLTLILLLSSSSS